MPTRFVCIAALLVCVLLPLRAQQAPVRIVLIAGAPSHPPGMHEFRAGALLLQKALSVVPGVTTQVFTDGWPTKIVDGKRVDDHAALAGASSVVIYADGDGLHPAIQRDHMKVIDGLAAKGIGLGFLHYAVAVAPGASGAAMQRWLGGFYDTKFSVNPMWAPSFSRFPAHPTTRGVAPFSTRDEWYFNMRWTSDVAAGKRLTPILVDAPTDAVRRGPYVSPPGPYPHIVAASGRQETMMWTFERPDGGRSFGFTGGHTHANWGDPGQRRVVANALLWIAKGEVPAGGVVDKIGPKDLTLNLDAKDQAGKPLRR